MSETSFFEDIKKNFRILISVSKSEGSDLVVFLGAGEVSEENVPKIIEAIKELGISFESLVVLKEKFPKEISIFDIIESLLHTYDVVEQKGGFYFASTLEVAMRILLKRK